MGEARTGYTQVGIYLPTDLVDKIKDIANTDRRTLSVTYEILLKKALNGRS